MDMKPLGSDIRGKKVPCKNKEVERDNSSRVTAGPGQYLEWLEFSSEVAQAGEEPAGDQLLELQRYWHRVLEENAAELTKFGPAERWRWRMQRVGRQN